MRACVRARPPPAGTATSPIMPARWPGLRLRRADAGIARRTACGSSRPMPGLNSGRSMPPFTSDSAFRAPGRSA
eukprot:5067608-Alexandrium_andersonii.AAC.1